MVRTHYNTGVTKAESVEPSTEAPALPDLSHKTVVVQGTSRGLGFALVHELVARGARVVATSRQPDDSRFADVADPSRVRQLRIDVTDEQTISAASAELTQTVGSVDLVLNVAGVLNGLGRAPERRWEDLDYEASLQAFRINALGPAFMARHFIPLLKHDRPAGFVSLSARIGSISDNRAGGWYSCRASKAAQNQLIRTLSIEGKRRCPNVVFAAIHPGTVDTDMSKPFQRSVKPNKLFSAPQAARYVLDVTQQLSMEQSGGYFAWDSQPIAY